MLSIAQLLVVEVSASLLNFSTGSSPVTIFSQYQSLEKDGALLFKGDVEVLVGNRMHVWADTVRFDKKNKVLYANKKGSSVISIEDKDFLIFADALTLDFNNKVGSAENLRIHVQEGFVSAQKAERLGQHKWELTKMCFTACDEEQSHWKIKAEKASLYGGYFIRVSSMLFKVGPIPLFYLPSMAFPIQSNTRTGFLIPKFYFDYNNGIGIKQEYYMKFAQRCDATLGVDWRRRRGAVFSTEFRWGRSPWCKTHINGHYAVSRDTFMHKEGRVVKGTRHRYWISGKDFQGWDNILGGKLNSLMFVDFGTDKRIGYQFFNTVDDIDDSFYNAWLLRLTRPQDHVQLHIDNISTSRKRFSDLTEADRKQISSVVEQVERLGGEVDAQASALWQKKTLENNVSLSKLPHLEWSTSALSGKGDLYYRHTMFVDQILLREQEKQRFLLHSLVAHEDKLIPLTTADIIRFNYQGAFGSFINWKDHCFNLEVNPTLQLRNVTKGSVARQKRVFEKTLFANGAARFFVDLGAEWALPEGFVASQNGLYSHFFQPVLMWKYSPDFEQNHWYSVDRWDRIYAQNALSFGLRNNWRVGPMNLYLHMNQGYSFVSKQSAHPLIRGVSHSNLMPLMLEAGVSNEVVGLELEQEYDWTKFRLLNSMIQARFSAKKIYARLGYLYQHHALQYERTLLSNIPHFLYLDIQIPLGKHVTIGYGGQFYSETGSQFMQFSAIQPLLHAVRVEYKGHCWGFSLGYEEKRYREFGNNKHERAIVFSLRLDTLGSFAKKFKRPEVIQESIGE